MLISQHSDTYVDKINIPANLIYIIEVNLDTQHNYIE